MANTRVYSRSFAGGELSPEMFGRLDDAKFQSGAATVRNFVVSPTGAAKNRAGFAYVKATKINGVARLISFTFSLNQTMVIELGDKYARFHTMGETLLYTTPQRPYVPQAAVTFTVGSPTIVTWTAHGLQNGDQVRFGSLSGVTYPVGVNSNVQYIVSVIDPNTFNIIDPATNIFVNVFAPASGGTIYGLKLYVPGEMCSFGGFIYLCYVQYQESPTVPSDPSTSAGSFYLEPVDTTYEIPTPYAAADLFAIHYVQSADVMTLVHPNYPPQMLERLSATTWVMTPIAFGPPLATPQSVGVAASPGYLAKISSVTDGTGAQAGNALITTESNHTLGLGDGVYVANLIFTPSSGPPQVLDGFYMVSLVPADISGNLINNELYLMDYSGNNFPFQSAGSYSFAATIQFGTKIFNIVSPYAVQAFKVDGVSSSLLSASVSVLNNLDVPGSYNTISWSAVAGALTYYIYKQFNGLWGFIGSTQALSFVDNNIAVDLSITPGTPYGVFSQPGDYPAAVCYFQQRKCFAGTLNAPQNAWMSNSGTESMFSYSIPSLATDSVVFRVAALQADAIQHLMPMLQLILLTSESEYALVPASSSAITPSSVDVNPQSYIGASTVQPTIVNTSMVYAAARGGHVREMGYAWTVNGYMTNDLSLRAAHLFDNLTIVDQAYSKSPWPIIWFVSSNGDLLGLTYIPEEQLGSWHHHDTEGTFESIACVSEGSEDVLYAVVNRTVLGGTVRYVERMATRLFDAPQDAFFVDAGATFDGTNTSSNELEAFPVIGSGPLFGTWNILTLLGVPEFNNPADIGSVLILTGSDGNKYRFKVLTVTATTEVNTLLLTPIPAGVNFPPTAAWAWARPTIGGLAWLEGCTVAVLADGGVQTQKEVLGAAITLDYPATVVQVGLPYISDLLTLPAVMQLDGYGQGRMKNVNKAWVKVYQSSSIKVGPDEDHLTEIAQRSTEPYGSSPALQTAELLVLTTPSWQTNGQTLIRQVNPLPLEVVGLTLEVAIGG